MDLEAFKFVPAEMRIQFIRELIGREGIRPLARKIGVNSKTVYKYKEGSSHPRDETMAKIWEVMKDNPDLFERQLDRLRSSFLEAVGPRGSEEISLKMGVPQIVDQKPTEEEVGVGESFSSTEVLERVGVWGSFERAKMEKVLKVFQDEPGLDLDEIVRRSGLSSKAVGRFVERLVSEGVLRETSPGVYELSRPIRLEG